MLSERRRGVVDPESNFCYGEGGAGTWSDGKLTTRIGRNSASVRAVLETLVSAVKRRRVPLSAVERHWLPCLRTMFETLALVLEASGCFGLLLVASDSLRLLRIPL